MDIKEEVQGVVPEIVTPDLEIKEESVETKEEVPKVEEVKQPDYSEHELKAMEKGWKPKDQFSGDPEDWKPAKQWLEFGDLLDTVHSLKRKSEESQRQIETVLEISKKAQEKQKEQLLAELKKQHREAIDLADYEKADEVVEKITELRTKKDDVVEQPKPETENKQPELHPDVIKEGQAFVERNKHWCNGDPANTAMVSEAKNYENFLVMTKPNLSPKERFERLEKHMREEFPTKFQNPNQNKPPVTETGNTDSNPKDRPKEYKVSDLPPDLQRIAKGLSPEAQKQYIKDCVTAGFVS